MEPTPAISRGAVARPSEDIWFVVVDETGIAERYRLLREMGMLDERSQRLWAAIEARAAGRGGIAAVVRDIDDPVQEELLAVELAAVKVLAFTLERPKTGRGEW